MNKKTAIFSILILMLAFLAFGIINVMMGRPSLLTSKLNGDKVETVSNKQNPTADSKETKPAASEADNKEFLKVKISDEIKEGASGDSVKKIQYILKDKKYFNGEIDGKLSQSLSDAVKVFQKDNSLEQTGKLTIDVIEKITGEKIDIDYSKIAFTRDLYPNMTGLDVRKAQYKLSKAGYYKGDINGSFDGETKKAVINFQKDKKISQTGNIGKITQKALDEIK